MTWPLGEEIEIIRVFKEHIVTRDGMEKLPSYPDQVIHRGRLAALSPDGTFVQIVNINNYFQTISIAQDRTSYYKIRLVEGPA